MKPIFRNASYLGVKLAIALILSLTLIVSDGRTKTMIKMRGAMETVVSWIYYLANTPKTVLDSVSYNLIDTNKLQIENKVLREQLQEKNADLLLLDHLRVENQRLRLLLNSPLRTDEYKKIAEILTVETDSYHQQVVINKGEEDGAYVGQSVIDDKGVVGQLISVGKNTSRVLLLTDITHSIPVQILRNDIRVIATGTGHNDELILENVPRSADIVKGDLLVTSGLGGRFLEGYPVAIVENVSRDGQKYFATITAKPLALIERLRYVLLLWPTNEDLRRISSSTPEDVRKVVRQRLETHKKQEALESSVTATELSQDKPSEDIHIDEPMDIFSEPVDPELQPYREED